VFGSGAEAHRLTEPDPGKRQRAGERVVPGGEGCGLAEGSGRLRAWPAAGLVAGSGRRWTWPAAGLAGVGCRRGEQGGAGSDR
jgi:hypothetical protein